MKLRLKLAATFLLILPTRAQDLSSRLEDLIHRDMSANHIDGMSVALVDHDHIVWSKDFNTSPGARYRVGSVSKLFTDIAIMQLVERGKLDLDAPIQRYIPEFHPANPFGKPITLRQLMSHRSGLVREPPIGHYFDASGPSLRDTVLSLNETELVYAPESKTKYSNAGVAVAGYVLEKVTGQPFAAYLKRQILQPLNMTRSAFSTEPEVMRGLAKAWMWTLDGRNFEAPTFALGMAPAGSMYSETSDLAKFAQALFHGGAPVIGRDTLEKMWTPQYGSAYGLGFHISKLNEHRLIGHGGAIYGFATELQLLPQEQLAAIAIATKDGMNPVTSQIAGQALRWMLASRNGQSLEPAEPVQVHFEQNEKPDRPKPVPLRREWQSLIGEYGWDFNTLYIHERDGKLTSLIEWFFFDPLEPRSDGSFRFPDHGLYAGEKATFVDNGVRIGGVLFPRRPDPAAPGQTFRVQLVRPISELLRTALRATPPVESGDKRPPDLVELVRLDPGIKLDIRYATDNNFMGAPLYSQPRAFMQKPAADALLRAHRNLQKLGYGLLIHDAYRPWFVTKMFWDGTPPGQHGFVANPAHGSRHNRGCAVDLTIYDLATNLPIQMTGGYDEFSTRSYPNYQGGTSLQRWHRDLLRRTMESEGFHVNDSEWWHFDYKDWERYPILNKRFESL